MALAPSFVSVPQQAKSLDTTTVTTAEGLVHRQVISLTDPENQGQYARLNGSSLNTHVTNTITISASTLPLPTGAATAAKQPAFGVAGTPSADVITVQGVSGGEPLSVDVLQPVVTKLAPSDYVHIAANGTTTAKSGAGLLRRIVINTKGSAANTLTVYDSTTGSGTVIAVIDTTNAGGSFDYELDFATGLTLVLASGTAADITVIFE